MLGGACLWNMEDQLSAQELVKKKDEIEEEISTQDQILKLVGCDIRPAIILSNFNY